MIADDGNYVDGSWLLTIRVDALSLDRQMRVKGDWSIGKVLVSLTENLCHPPQSPTKPNDISLSPGLANTGWSDFALWWPAKNRWILQTHASLDQYGLQADARLHFIRIHGRLKIQLPDLQTREFCDINFTEPVFRVVLLLCRHLGIKHPEELSLQHVDPERFLKPKPLNWEERWSTLPASARKSFKKLTLSPQPKLEIRQPHPTLPPPNQHPPSPINLIDQGVRSGSANQTLGTRRPLVYGPPKVRNRPVSGNATESMYLSQTLFGTTMTLLTKHEVCDDHSLVCSPRVALGDALHAGSVTRLRNFHHRARFSAVWLELGRSLMEQGIYPTALNYQHAIAATNGVDGKENVDDNAVADSNDAEEGDESKAIATLRLRFKYNIFYDLTRKNNSVRINQLFEQARWAIVSEEVECTNEEAALFAALQVQLQQVAGVVASQHIGSSEPRSYSQSVDLGVDRVSRSISPPMRKLSSYYGGSSSSLTGTASPSGRDLDQEIDLLLDDLTSTCLQQDRFLTASTTTRSIMHTDAQQRHHFARSDAKKRMNSFTKKTKTPDDLDVALPELAAYLKVCKPRMFGLKTYRRLYVVLKKTTMEMYKTEEDYVAGLHPIDSIRLQGCESWPDVSPTVDRFAVKILTPLARAPLPLSSALTTPVTSTNQLSTRLRRRASLLSLTSLGGLTSVCGRAVSRASGLLNEVIIRLPDEAAYVDWSSAILLAGRLSGGTGCSPSTIRRLFDAEKRAKSSLLQLLTPMSLKITKTDASAVSAEDRMWLHRNIHELLPYRLARVGGDFDGSQTTKSLSKASESPVAAVPTPKEEANEQLVRHILDIRSRLPDAKAIDIKLQYISHWQQLADNGVIHFPARFETSVPIDAALGLPPDTPDEAYRSLTMNSSHVHSSTRQVTISISRRDEVVGIGNGRVARHDQSTGEIHASWRFDNIQGWNVNRELNELTLVLAPTPSTFSTESPSPIHSSNNKPMFSGGGRVIIRPISVSVLKVSEVLGANVFLNMRSPSKSQDLDESLFYRLIGASPVKTVTSATR